jgi:hypothetical protein
MRCLPRGGLCNKILQGQARRAAVDSRPGFKFVINLKTAKLSASPSLHAFGRADEVTVMFALGSARVGADALRPAAL